MVHDEFWNYYNDNAEAYDDGFSVFAEMFRDFRNAAEGVMDGTAPFWLSNYISSRTGEIIRIVKSASAEVRRQERAKKQYLKPENCIISSDNDIPGRDFAEKMAKQYGIKTSETSDKNFCRTGGRCTE